MGVAVVQRVVGVAVACVAVVGVADQLKGQVDYIAASHTIMTPMHQRAKELGWTVHPFEGDHSMIVGQPEKMVEFLQTLA